MNTRTHQLLKLRSVLLGMQVPQLHTWLDKRFSLTKGRLTSSSNPEIPTDAESVEELCERMLVGPGLSPLSCKQVADSAAHHGLACEGRIASILQFAGTHKYTCTGHQ